MNIHSRFPLAPLPWALEVRNLTIRLGQLDILEDITLQFPQGGQSVIIGPNGGGKTTFIRALLGEIPFQKGQFIFTPPDPRLGYVPQRLDFDRHLPLTVGEFLALGLTNRPLWLGSHGLVPKSEAVLSEVRAEHLIKRRLGDLSGGELQRVLLAAALSQNPEILVLDEPATGVDVYGEQLLCEILEGLKGRFTIIMVSHDLPTAKAHADWVLCLNRRLIAQGPADSIFNSPALTATFGLHSRI